MARRGTEIDELIEDAGGIKIGHGRVPGWLLLVVVGVVAFGLYYLIQYTVNDAGSFSTEPTKIVGMLGL